MTTDPVRSRFLHANLWWRLIPSVLAFTLGLCPIAQGKETSRPPVPRQAELPRIAFDEFVDRSTPEPKLSRRLLELSGQRVKLVGFMAKMEVAPKGAFYLSPRPVSCDEEGGGTADLPPEAVFVVVRSSAGKEIPHSPRALEVTGLLDVGYRVGEDDRVTHVRLLLDRPDDLLGKTPKHKRPTTPTEARP